MMDSDSDPDDPREVIDNCAVPAKKSKVSDYFCKQVDSESEESVAIPASDVNTKEPTKDGDISAEDMAKVQKPQSLVWLFFTKVDGKTARCNTCGSIRSTPDSTTTTLKSHLNKEHPKCHQEFERLGSIKEKLNKPTVRPESKKKQSLLKDSLKGIVKFEPESQKAKKITRAIAKFICKGTHPSYSIVEEPSFLELVCLLEPRYDVPSRTTFSRYIIPKLYAELKDNIKKDLSGSTRFESLSITTDLWTSRAGDSYMAFTLQHINDNFEMKTVTLDCLPFPGKHDSLALKGKIKSVLAEWELDNAEISKYIVADNGRNIAKALREDDLGDNAAAGEGMQDSVGHQKSDEGSLPAEDEQEGLWTHITCYNHTMQLAVEDTKKAQKAGSVFDKFSGQVGRYNKSKPARESLHECQKEHKLPEHSLVQMVPTRWGNEFYMLERFVEQKAAIISEQSKAGVDSLSVAEWKLVEGYVMVSKIVANFTADRVVTACQLCQWSSLCFLRFNLN